MTSDGVIVGVDGSASSQHAVRWAAREAARRRVLLLVNAYQLDACTGAPIDAELAQGAEFAAKFVVGDALTEATAVAPGLEVSGVAVLGPPAEALIEAGRDAALLVVGCRGHNGFSAALVGATGLQVATHATCPVVVVRGRGDNAIGPVVAGVDGSAGSPYVLEWAYQQAASRGCALVPARTIPRNRQPVGKRPVVPVQAKSDLRVWARIELARQVSAAGHRYPAISPKHLVVSGNAADVLVELSRGAQLVVVGTRGHGGFPGLLLGSVALHLLHHADCPVLIVRADPAATAAPRVPG